MRVPDFGISQAEFSATKAVWMNRYMRPKCDLVFKSLHVFQYPISLSPFDAAHVHWIRCARERTGPVIRTVVLPCNPFGFAYRPDDNPKCRRDPSNENDFGARL